MVEKYLRIYLNKRKELEEAQNRPKNLGFITLLIIFLIITIVMIIVFCVMAFSGEKNMSVFGIELYYIFIGLLLVSIIMLIILSLWENKIKNKNAERNIERNIKNYNKMIKDLKNFFDYQGINTDEKRKKLLEDISNEKKRIIELSNRPKQLLTKFIMGIVVSALIGTLQAIVQGYMDNYDTKEAQNFMDWIIVIIIGSILITFIAYVCTFLYSMTYDGKIQNYSEFEKDFTEMLYMATNNTQSP